MKNSPYSFGNKFEFGYAITTHMSQGSEFNNGIYFEEFLNRNINNNELTIIIPEKYLNNIVSISTNIVLTSKKSVGGLIFNILNGKSL